MKYQTIQILFISTIVVILLITILVIYRMNYHKKVSVLETLPLSSDILEIGISKKDTSTGYVFYSEKYNTIYIWNRDLCKYEPEVFEVRKLYEEDSFIYLGELE